MGYGIGDTRLEEWLTIYNVTVNTLQLNNFVLTLQEHKRFSHKQGKHRSHLRFPAWERGCPHNNALIVRKVFSAIRNPLSGTSFFCERHCCGCGSN